jgi:Baseplate J-like protein
MAITIPNLDDRSFDDYRAELVRLIPTYTPEWTDHNETDPGIALLELFAYLATQVQARVNRIPDATFAAFLRLLDIPLLSALPARALAVADSDRLDLPNIPKGTEFKAGSLSFESEGEVAVWPVEAIGFVKEKAPDPAAKTMAANRREEQEVQVKAKLPAGTTAPLVFFETRQLAKEPTDPTQFDLLDKALDHSLWIGLFHHKNFDPASVDSARVLFIGVGTKDTVDVEYDLGKVAADLKCTGLDDKSGVAAPGMRWKIWHADRPTKTGTTDDPGWTPVEVVGDSSRGLTRNGVVQLTMPHPFRPFSPAPRTAAPTVGMSTPPPVDDPALAARLLGWLQVSRPDGETPLTGIGWVGANAVTIVQSRPIPALELLGSGDSAPFQRFRLAQPNALPGTIKVFVDEAQGRFEWQEVEHFGSSGSTDRHFMLDRSTSALAPSEVVFGPGLRPQYGERVMATYRVGGGVAGNVRANSITRIVGADGIKVTNPFPARFGRDQESEADAIARMPAWIRTRERAVTAEDFAGLAQELPEVGRAIALRLFHPSVPTNMSAGVVSVVIFPRPGVRDPRRPMPPRSLLRAVCAYLDERRLLTTELYVIAPVYVPLYLSVAIEVASGAQVDRVRLAVKQRLEQHLSSLAPGGPHGDGWPLGRTVRLAELQAEAVRVEGVDFVRAMRMVSDRETRADIEELALRRWQSPGLVSLNVVTTSTAPDPVSPDQPPTGGDDVVLVPVAREVC